MSKVFCNPDICPNCQYIGYGDSWCDVTGEIVLADWAPTDAFMGEGCPYSTGPHARKHLRNKERRATS